MNSKSIAISAISSALCAIALTLGAYFSVVDLLALVLASACVIIPTFNGSKWGGILTFLAGGVIAILASGFNFIGSMVFPAYFAFFGLYPLLRVLLLNKNIKKYAIMIIGAIWCVLAIYGIFYYYMFVMGIRMDNFPEWFPEFLSDNLVYFLGLIGVIFYFVFDRYVIVMHRFYQRYIGRIIKR